MPVLPDDTVESLSARILVEEHRLYAELLRWFTEDRVSITAGTGRVSPKG